MATAILGGILIGGSSSRMGQPKHLCQIDGRTFFERVVAALQPHVDQVVAIGAGELPAAPAGSTRLDDVAGVRGPLAGILAALRWRSDATWLVAACDLPFVTPAAIAWLLAQAAPDRAAVIPRIDDRGVEPLLALYTPRIGSAVEQLVAASVRGPCKLVELPDVHCPQVPPELVDCWRNVNEPDDLDWRGR